SEAAGKEQYLIPYLITGHPGATLTHAVELALYLKRRGMRPRQVQDFIPTPMSMATAMYHSGLDPFSLEPVYTAKTLREKRMMKALAFYWDKEQWPMAREALLAAGRKDLIGRASHCLVPPGYGATAPVAGRPSQKRRVAQKRTAASGGRPRAAIGSTKR